MTHQISTNNKYFHVNNTEDQRWFQVKVHTYKPFNNLSALKTLAKLKENITQKIFVAGELETLKAEAKQIYSGFKKKIKQLNFVERILYNIRCHIFGNPLNQVKSIYRSISQAKEITDLWKTNVRMLLLKHPDEKQFSLIINQTPVVLQKDKFEELISKLYKIEILRSAFNNKAFAS